MGLVITEDKTTNKQDNKKGLVQKLASNNWRPSVQHTYEFVRMHYGV